MKCITRWLGPLFVIVLASCLCGSAWAATPTDPMATVDSGIAALGGAERLNKIKGITWTTVETTTSNGVTVELTTRTSIGGITVYRQETNGQQGGNPLKRIVILADDKGTRLVNGNRTDLNPGALANLKRLVYLTAIPVTLLPLKDSAYRLEALPDEPVDNIPATVIKVTPPDNKDFKLYFAKSTGLPVKLVATMVSPSGAEFTQETIYGDYQETNGLKKAMRILGKQNGAKTQEQHLTDVKVVDKTDAAPIQGQ